MPIANEPARPCRVATLVTRAVLLLAVPMATHLFAATSVQPSKTLAPSTHSIHRASQNPLPLDPGLAQELALSAPPDSAAAALAYEPASGSTAGTTATTTMHRPRAGDVKKIEVASDDSDRTATSPAPLAAQPSHPAQDEDRSAATLQQALANGRQTRISFDASPSMTVEQASVITVKLTLNDAVDAAKKADRDAGYARTIAARLFGADFEIKPLAPELRTFPTVAPVEWSWTVTPKKAGKQALHLSLAETVSTEQSSLTQSFPTFDHTVEVALPWNARFEQYFAPYREWIAAVSFVAVFVGLWLYARGRRRRRMWFHEAL